MGKNYSPLSIEERTMIQTPLEMGMKPAAIALGLNRSASTLSRELNRNGWVGAKARCAPGRRAIAGGSRAAAAQERAHTHTVAPHVVRRLRAEGPLWGRVVRYLKKGYSPEQIAGTLALVHTDTPALRYNTRLLQQKHPR